MKNIWITYALILTIGFRGYAQESYLLDECYNFHHKTSSWNNFFATQIIASDFVLKGGGGPTDLPELEQVDNYSISPDSGVPLDVWNTYYYGIEKCNQVLVYLKDNTDNQVFRAEAKFLRAYDYFHLVRLFGGVPLLLDQCENFEASLSRVSKNEIFVQIIKDLEEAIPFLPLKSSLSDSQKYKATRGAARAVLANAYVYLENWLKASEQLNIIISSGEYALLTDYSDLWLESNEHNAESIFEYEFYSDQNYDWNFPWDSYSTNLHIHLMGPRGVSSDNPDVKVGWGFVNPTQDLVDFYETGDLRKDASVISLRDMSDYQSNHESFYDYTGYESLKYTTRSENLPPAGVIRELNYGQNVVKIRYAEVLLLQAEVSVRMGNNVASLNFINQVRARAGLADLSSGLSSEDLLEAIFDERAVEFALEGKRYLDLLRFGKAKDALSSRGWKEDTNGLWPIPNKYLEENPMMTQNPGYTGGIYKDVITPELIKNTYEPKPNFPWVKNEEKKDTPIEISAYVYSYCLTDSVELIKSRFEYNNISQMTACIQSSYNMETEVWSDFFKYGYTYDGENNLRSSFSLVLSDNNWDTTYINYYKYPSEFVFVDSASFLTDNAPSYYSVDTYTFDDTSNQYELSNRYWTWENSEWNEGDEFLRIKSFKYDNNGNIIEEIVEFQNDDGTWEKRYLNKFNYNNELLVKKEEWRFVNYTLSKTTEVIYEYNNDSRLVAKKESLASSGFSRFESGSSFQYESGKFDYAETPLIYHGLLNRLNNIGKKIFYKTGEPTILYSNQIEELEIDLYPNPAKGEVTIAGELKYPVEVQIFDLTGTKIKSMELNQETLDISDLMNGLYLLRIDNLNKALRLLIE